MAEEVLRNRELFWFIVRYQDGLPKDIGRLRDTQMHASCALKLYRLYHMEKDPKRATIKIDECMEKIKRMIKPWYEQERNVQRLLRHVPSMHFPMLLYFAITPNESITFPICHVNLSEDVYEIIFSLSASNGNMKMMKSMEQFVTPKLFPTHMLDLASANGHLHIVEYLYQLGAPSKFAMNLAAKYGHEDVLKYLHDNNVGRCTKAAMNLASEGGHLSIVVFLHENRTEGCTKRAIDAAASMGHESVVRFLVNNRTEGWTVRAIENAKFNGNMEIANFLEQCGQIDV